MKEKSEQVNLEDLKVINVKWIDEHIKMYKNSAQSGTSMSAGVNLMIAAAFCKVKDKVLEERNFLVEAMKYTQHLPDCDLNNEAPINEVENVKCTCGLDVLKGFIK